MANLNYTPTRCPEPCRGRCCARCGRTYLQAQLNYEKLYHHPIMSVWGKTNELLCIDRKTCERLRRKRG